MENRRYVDKSKRPSFSTNEELEKYLTKQAEQCEQEKKRRAEIEEWCRLKREDAYRHESTEIKPGEHNTPRISDDGKTLSSFTFCEDYNRKLTVPEGVEKIAIFAFHMNRELVQIILPSSLKVIDDFAFAECGIKEIEIPEGVKIIPSCAFQKCKNLERVTLPCSIIEIQDHAFEKCQKLREINVPDDCIIGWSVFPNNLPDLQKLEMPWEEMRVYEEWKKTHDNILEWKNQREEIMSVEYKRIADEKAKEAAEREEWNREYKKKHRFDAFFFLLRLIKVIFFSILALIVILVAIFPLCTWWLISLIFHKTSPWDYLRKKIREQ